MTIEKDFVPVPPLLSVTLSAKLYVPALVGVPDNIALVPDEVKLKPGGRSPLIFFQV